MMRAKKRKSKSQQVIDYDKVWTSILSHKLDEKFHAVLHDIENGADQVSRVDRYGFAGLKVNSDIVFLGESFYFIPM